MKKDPSLTPEATDLRRRAEAQGRAQPTPAPGPPPTEAESQRLIHELHVHQIELELQNEELRETRARLERSLERYTDLYDFAPVGYFTLTDDGTILEANLAGAALLGQERSRLLGARFGLFVSQETRPRFNRFLSQVLAGTGQACCEVALVREGTPTCHVHLEGAGAGGGAERQCRLAAMDVTARQQAEEALRRREEQYRAVIETSPDGFWIADRQGRVLETNAAYARLSGYSADELRSLHVADLEASESPAAAARLDQIVREGNGLFLTRHRAKSGRLWQAEVNIAYWPIEGGRFFAFIRDVNRRQRSETLLKVRLHLSDIALTGRLDDILQAALDAAERLTGSQTGFFHFVDPAQEHPTLQTWSTHAPNGQGPAEGQGLHDPIDRPESCVPPSRELTVPIQRHERVIALIGVGNKPEDYTDDDVAVVQELASMVMDLVERKRAEDRIAHLAYHDALTQLPNRVLLSDRLRQAMAQARRERRWLAVCYLDLDGFKPINDTWGHTQGDRVLVEIAHRLQGCVRAGDTVARLGGDEFVLLLMDLADPAEYEHALDRTKRALQAPFAVVDQTVRLTASLGVTLYPADNSDPDLLLRHADQAMYVAKQAGGNCVRVFDPDHDRRDRRDRAILQQVQDGLAAGEFRLYYQPKLDMRHGTVVGAEALLRWQHPQEGLLPPAGFMPVVEASDLAVAVDRWVLNEALRQMAIWASRGLRLPVSVNLSGRHLQQPDFVARLRALLAAYPTVPADRLELEILETAALEDLATLSTLIAGCRQLGVRFALDDFGTGYSSLTHLQYLAVDLLKIDRSFVHDLLLGTEAPAIVAGVIGLSAAFHLGVIAEGVETVAQGSRLLDLGCDFAQGYGIAPPMPPEQIPGWIAGWTSPGVWTTRGGPR